MNHKLRAARLLAEAIITAEAERRARPRSSERRALRLFKLERCHDALYSVCLGEHGDTGRRAAQLLAVVTLRLRRC